MLLLATTLLFRRCKMMYKMWIFYCIVWITGVWAYENETDALVSIPEPSASAAFACHRLNMGECNACQENPVRMKSLYNLLLNLGEMHHVDIQQRFPASFLPPEPWVQALKEQQEKYKEWETVATIPIEQVFAAALWQCPLPKDQMMQTPSKSVLSAWQYHVQVDKKTARYLKSSRHRLATFFERLQTRLSAMFKKGFHKLSSFCLSLGKKSSQDPEWGSDTLQLCLSMAQSIEQEWIHQPAGLVFLFDQMKEFSQHDVMQHPEKQVSFIHIPVSYTIANGSHVPFIPHPPSSASILSYQVDPTRMMKLYHELVQVYPRLKPSLGMHEISVISNTFYHHYLSKYMTIKAIQQRAKQLEIQKMPIVPICLGKRKHILYQKGLPFAFTEYHLIVESPPLRVLKEQMVFDMAIKEKSVHPILDIPYYQPYIPLGYLSHGRDALHLFTQEQVERAFLDIPITNVTTCLQLNDPMHTEDGIALAIRHVDPEGKDFDMLNWLGSFIPKF